MGLNNTYGLGRNVRACVAIEAAGTFGNGPGTTGFNAVDSFQVLGGVSVEPAENRTTRMDARQSRSTVERILGKRTNNCTVRSYVLCPTTVGNLPDVNPLMTAALGVQGGGLGSAVTYSLSAAQNLGPSLTALFEYNGVMSDQLRGWVIEEFGIEIPQDDQPSFEFVGPAREHIHTGTATATAALTGGATTEVVTLGAGETRNFDVGSYVNIGTVTGLVITAINHTTNAITVADPDGVTNVASGTGTAVVPHTPYAETTVALIPSSLISSINGQLDLDGATNLTFQSASIRVKNGWAPVDPALSQLVADFNPGYREVSGSLTFWVRDLDVIRARGRARFDQNSGVNGIGVPLTILLGGNLVGEGQVTIEMPNVMLDFAAAEIPEGEAGSIQVPFVALATDIDDEDEILITFDVTT